MCPGTAAGATSVIVHSAVVSTVMFADVAFGPTLTWPDATTAPPILHS